MDKHFAGLRLQRLREEHGLSQVALARALEISASYLNQIEHDLRPLTLPVMLRIKARFGMELEALSDSEQAGLIGDLREALADLGDGRPSLAEIKMLAAELPGVGRTLLQLHRDYRAARERADALAARFGDAELASASPAAGDLVRDYFNRRRNHIAELDEPAERWFTDAGLAIGQMAAALRHHLMQRHRVRVVADAEATDAQAKRDYDAQARVLRLPDYLQPGQQAFQMAAQLALLEQGDAIEALIAAAGFDDPEQQRLARIGLANYFAGAVVMPYSAFLDAAERCGYDIERLAQRFGVGFEAVCHRLSTLQRPGAAGLPFFFIRVDRAGNVSKRHSATDFHFSRVGGSCPLWIVYEAFNQPGRVLTQIAGMPDGRRHFWVARQVSSGPAGYGSPRKTFAVSLGCDLHHAGRLVYSRGLDLKNAAAATPIGAGCKVCDRTHCAQRAFPALPGYAPATLPTA